MSKREQIFFSVFVMLIGIFALLSSINYGEIIDTQLELKKEIRQNHVMIRAMLNLQPFRGTPNRMVDYGKRSNVRRTRAKVQKGN